MSPTSYRTAPPRVVSRILPQRLGTVPPCAAAPGHRLAGRRARAGGLGGHARLAAVEARASHPARGRSAAGRRAAAGAAGPHRRARAQAAAADGGARAAATVDGRVHGAVERRKRRPPAGGRRPRLLHQVTARVAAVDIGSNSTRLLVADVEDGTLREVERLLEITRLGDGVDASGALAANAMTRVERCVAEYARRAADLGASQPLAVATSAVRDAANGGAFLERLVSRTGAMAMLLSGDEEARMTLRGVSSARPAGEPVVVCDIGGGS